MSSRNLPADGKERRAAWRKARAVCSLTDAQIAHLMDRSEALIRHYRCASGTCPTWKAIRILDEYNLQVAMKTIADRFGDEAVVRVKEAA
jgi:hypothetical protein